MSDLMSTHEEHYTQYNQLDTELIIASGSLLAADREIARFKRRGLQQLIREGLADLKDEGINKVTIRSEWADKYDLTLIVEHEEDQDLVSRDDQLAIERVAGYIVTKYQVCYNKLVDATDIVSELEDKLIGMIRFSELTEIKSTNQRTLVHILIEDQIYESEFDTTGEGLDIEFTRSKKTIHDFATTTLSEIALEHEGINVYAAMYVSPFLERKRVVSYIATVLTGVSPIPVELETT
ncbi:hypothetical protein HYT52_00790 [Candidatus Woesearchaeota archaeon]|nr:hypothetical protein [Candidatus Woesearchaeota archaeon]